MCVCVGSNVIDFQDMELVNLQNVTMWIFQFFLKKGKEHNSVLKVLTVSCYADWLQLLISVMRPR